MEGGDTGQELQKQEGQVQLWSRRGAASNLSSLVTQNTQVTQNVVLARGWNSVFYKSRTPDNLHST